MSGAARIPREDRLRASDADRDRVIDLLAQAAAEGRLTLEEYSERSETALAARTQGELAGLTTDIPVSPVRAEVGTAAEKMTAVPGSASRSSTPPSGSGR